MQRTAPIRVIIADDHPVVRIGVRNVLAAHGRFSVVAEADNGAETVRQALSLQPEILLLDVQMPNSSGFSTIREVAAAAPRTRTVLLTGSIPPDQLMEAFNAGARGIVFKNAMTEQIAAALLAVMDGGYWAQSHRVEQLSGILDELKAQTREATPEEWNLTRRELEVVGLIVRGCSNRDIAGQFNLSEETVKRHLSNIFEKLGISTRLELAVMAIAKKLVPGVVPVQKPPLPTAQPQASNPSRAS